MPTKRFRIAFSFAGEKREFVEKVAELLGAQFGKDQILYDKYHEAEFARFNLGIYLPKLYGQQSDLIVPVICPDYDEKLWTGWEWVHVYGLLTKADGHRVMPSRFEHAVADGLSPAAGFIELDNKTPEQFVELILQRLALNEGHPRDHYTNATKTHTPSTANPPSNLPGGYIGQLFLGREDFLRNLRTSLLKQTHTTAITQRPAATVTEGLGGLGKTHAAVEYAHRHRGDYTALLFVSGDTPQRLQTSLASLCEVPGLHLNDNLPPEEVARAGIALHWLATHPSWLLIVDNVDDEPSALALREHFEQLRPGHVLITSRLHNWSNNVDPLDLSVLSEGDAIDLLLKLTDKHRRKAADDDVKVLTLAEVMDGLPLALHQAAGYINEQSCTFAEYVTIYKDKAAELLNWSNDLIIPYERPDKSVPRPVLITWKTSFDQLSEESRFWLLVFSHFAPEPIPEFLLDGADKALFSELPKFRRLLECYISFFKPRIKAREALAQADKFNLITRYDDPPRFKVHRLVQEVTRLSASVQERTAALALGIQLIQEGHPGDPQDVRTWAQWTPLQPHALALCQHAPDKPAPKRLTWLLGALSLLLNIKSLHSQAEPLMRRALQIDEDRYGPEHPEVAIDLNNLASLLHATNRRGEAEPLMRRALQIDEASYGSEHPEVARDLNNLALLLMVTNRLEEAEPPMRRAFVILVRSLALTHPNSRSAGASYIGLLQALKLPEAEIKKRMAAATRGE